jgi:tRNA A-37 threonylcarbamoyl transferase component Bud32
MKIPCIHPEKKYFQHENTIIFRENLQIQHNFIPNRENLLYLSIKNPIPLDIPNERQIKVTKKQYTINTNLDRQMIDLNFKRILRSINKYNKQNVNYFRSFLKHFYDYEISENEIKNILKKIRTIKFSVKRDFIEFSNKDGKKIHHIIQSIPYFYIKKTNDFCVFLYKTTYNHQDVIVKVYKYFPKYIFSKCLLEHRFENEVIFQSYANSLNSEIDFISPEVYSFGKISIPEREDSMETNYLFIIMEYVDGITLQHLDFRPELCKKIYEIDEKLKQNLLNHNDIKSRNIIISEKDDLVLLDYGESLHCI